MRNYIPVKKYWFEMYTKYDRPYWIPALKFPIEKIKIDKSLFGYHNEVSHSIDICISNRNKLNWFHETPWDPSTA